MNVRLLLQRKHGAPWVLQLHGPEATVGRARGCTIRVPSSEVSRLHCRLRVGGEAVTVEDLESINGTFVNGERVRAAHELRPGDRLTVGPATFVVEYDLPGLEVAEPAEVEAAEEAPVVELEEDLPVAEPEVPFAEPVDLREAIAEGALPPPAEEVEDFVIDLDDLEERGK